MTGKDLELRLRKILTALVDHLTCPGVLLQPLLEILGSLDPFGLGLRADEGSDPPYVAVHACEVKIW